MARVASYLSKYDTEWYNENSPEKRERWRREREKRLDKCDNVTLSKIQEHVIKMLKEDPPVRITWHGVTARLRQTTTIRSRLRTGKLPNSEKFLDQVAEGRRDYAIRRLCSTISHYASNGELPNYTCFAKKTSISYSFYPDLSLSAYDVLKSYIEEKKCIPEKWKASEIEMRIKG
jgi:hypothetical protein